MVWIPLAVLMGLALGLLGGGGSILAVPIFVYAIGYGEKEAIAASLLIVGITSLVASLGHWREGRVRLRVVLLFGAVAGAGAFFSGRFLSGFLSGTVQLVLFAFVMLAASFFMFRGSSVGDGPGGAEGSVAKLAAPGAGVGVLTGLVGVGGGFLIVPALVLFGGLTMEVAVGSSLMVIAANSFAGFAGYLGEVQINWGREAAFSVFAIAGSFVGAYLVNFIPSGALRKSFAGFLVAMALFILFENLGAIL